MGRIGTASSIISELREFAAFTPREQRYIRRSLDIGLGRTDAFKRWARNADEVTSIRRQYLAYRTLQDLAAERSDDPSFEAAGAFTGKLVAVTAFDLSEGMIESFPAYRFLYERLLGAWVRPWLPSAFCAASALPQLQPGRRTTLLRSISEAAAAAPGWSDREAGFYPEWIDKDAA